MRNEIDFPSAPQEISRKQYPLKNRSQPKTIKKQSTPLYQNNWNYRPIDNIDYIWKK